nr:HAMP domain-containing histidine kinase [Butyrivibrio sp.]
IVTNESELVVPFNNNSMLYSRILTSEKGQNALRSIRKQMSADSFGAKAVKYDKVYYYMFESEIGDTGLFILGFVPAEYISINVWHIVLLVGWVFFFMATILLVFVYYTYKTESKAFEANALVKTYKENESTENINVLLLSNMAKEFKAPLNSIINMNEMILKDPSELLVKEYASKIKASGIALNSTINDVIDFVKLKNGSLEITPEQYDLKNEIETLYKMTSILAEEKNLELKVEINKSIPRILYGDIRRLRGVILNLITNAIKYTERGEVLIRFWYVKTDKNNIMLNVSVKDTGIGIKQEDIGKLYAPYEKINEISKDVLSGTGLGLNIAKEVLGLMGSSLKIESEYGSGSEFSFEVNQTVIEWEPIGKIAMNRIKK